MQQPAPPRPADDAVVILSRNGFGDPRTFAVPYHAITDACIALKRGGDWQWLPGPTLSVHVRPEYVPAELRGGKHTKPVPMLMVLEREGTDPIAFASLEADGEEHRHSREYAERLERKWAKRARRSQRGR